jgi:peptidoglycan/xylan/chitin deacetylase (PgdA/CDA1 family)
MNPLPTFPNGAHCAVSLTYDDGIPSHIEDVAPTLEACGLRGTFNIPIARASVMERAGDWRALAARGHELGNHSLFHPCRSTPEDPKPFVGPYNLVDYDERRLREELQVANFALHMIDGLAMRTYANTCWHRTFGSGADEQPMEPILADYFLAARGALIEGPVDLSHPDWMNLGSVWGDRHTFAQLRDQIEDLLPAGGWIIYTFHGVGQGTHNLFIDHAEHRQFADWLGQNQSRIYTAPMIDIVKLLKPRRHGEHGD